MFRCLRCGKIYFEIFMLKCDCGGMFFVEREYFDFFGSFMFYFDVRRYINFLFVSGNFFLLLVFVIMLMVEF